MSDDDDDPRPIAVVDIDGVLADVRHRLHHVRRQPKDWDAFFAAMADDPLLPEGLAVATELAERHRVVYVTGRPRRFGAVTAGWLARHELPLGQVRHRADGDRRPARVVKTELIRSLTGGPGVAIVVDDDLAVLAALHDAGFTVFPADWAGPHPTLHAVQEGGDT